MLNVILDVYNEFDDYSNYENVTLVPETVFEIPISGYENSGDLYCLCVTSRVETNAIINANLYLDTNGKIADWFALVAAFDITKIEFLSFRPNNELWDDETMYFSRTQMNEDGVLGLDMNRLSSSTNTSGNNVYSGYFTLIVSNNGEFYELDLNVFSISIYDAFLDDISAIQIINNVDGFNTAYLSGEIIERNAFLYIDYYDCIDEVASRSCSNDMNNKCHKYVHGECYYQN